MKTILISSMALPCFLVCFSLTGYSQQLPPMQQEYHPRENITGVGTNTIVYHLLPNYQVKSVQDIEAYLGRIDGIDEVQVSNENITVHFEEIIRGQEIHMIFERVEMYYIQVPSKSKQ